MKLLKNIFCIFIVCAFITPYAVYAENSDMSAQTEEIVLMSSVEEEPEGGALTENEKAFCYAVVEGFMDMEERIDVSSYHIPVEKFYSVDENGKGSGLYMNVSSLIQTCYPQLFYSYGSFSYKYSNDGYITTIIPSYKMTADEVSEAQRYIDAELNNIAARLTSDMTDFEKVLAVHDYIIDNYTYDVRVYYGNNDEVRSIDRFVKEKTGVCEAYSVFFKYVMNALGMDCETVPSDYSAHMWNKVKVDGEWYNIDLTQDDPILGDEYLPYLSDQAFHQYFLLTDEEIMEVDSEGGDHLAWNSKNWAGEDVTVSSATPLVINTAKDIYGVIAHENGKSYYIDSTDVNLNSNPKTTNNIMLLNTKDGSSSVVYTFDNNDIWHPETNPRAYYQCIFSNLAEYNGKVYFNTPSKVLRLDPESDVPTEVYDFTEEYPESKVKSNTYLYGVIVREDTLLTVYNKNIQDLSKNTLLTVMTRDDIPETPSPKPSTEPSPKPSTEPSPEPSTEPSPEPSPEPSTEPTPLPEPLEEPVIETKVDEETQKVTELTVTTVIPEERKEEAVVYIAQYDDKGLLLGIVPVSESEATTFAPEEEATLVKAFIWNAFNYPLSTCNVCDLLKPR